MKRLSLVAFGCLFCFASVYADNLKVGVVNMDEIIQKSPLAVSLNEKLSKDFMPRQDQLNDAQKKLQTDMDQLNYNSFQLSNADRAKLQATINADRRQFEVLNASLQKDLAASQQQYTQQLMTKFNSIVSKLAQDGHYDMIQTNANVLFLNSAIDVTPQIIQQLK